MSHEAIIQDSTYSIFRITIDNANLTTGTQIDDSYIQKANTLKSILTQHNIIPYKIQFVTSNIIRIYTINVNDQTLTRPLQIIIDYSKPMEDIKQNIKNLSIVLLNIDRQIQEIDARIKDRIYYKQYEQ